jgi:nucleoid-associated protein YgaU
MILNNSRYAGTILYQGTKAGKERVTIDTALKKIKLSQSAVTHKVIDGDTLENISYRYYSDSTYWWVIADANDIFDPDVLTIGALLNIP